MQSQQVENSYQCKIVIIGDTMVGKTSILQRFVKETLDFSLQPTIGVAFFHKTVYLNKNMYKIEIYDTAGQERFNSLVPMYYQRANFCFIVFDLTNESTFERVEYWGQELNRHKDSNGRQIQRAVVGNKADKEEGDKLNNKATGWCRAHDLQYFRVSALVGTGVQDMFHEVLLKNQWQTVDDQGIRPPAAQKGCC